MAFCKGCGLSIEWKATSTGRSMPVDIKRVRAVLEEGGALRIVLHDGSVKAAREPRKSDAPEAIVSGRTSHFATCPKASMFRKPKQGTLGFGEDRS